MRDMWRVTKYKAVSRFGLNYNVRTKIDFRHVAFEIPYKFLAISPMLFDTISARSLFHFTSAFFLRYLTRIINFNSFFHFNLYFNFNFHFSDLPLRKNILFFW